MEIQKHIDKMVMVPIERWKQLLELEKKYSEEVKQTDTTAEDSEQPDTLPTDVEQNNNNKRLLIPPGIPDTKQATPTTQSPKKKRKTVGKNKNVTLLSSWMPLT